ncbi:hypothetical protein E143388_06494 [Rhodococcus opacus]|nr:hypothetical protein E143388_06494 [Rhodococcus opacus]
MQCPGSGLTTGSRGASPRGAVRPHPRSGRRRSARRGRACRVYARQGIGLPASWSCSRPPPAVTAWWSMSATVKTRRCPKCPAFGQTGVEGGDRLGGRGELSGTVCRTTPPARAVRVPGFRDTQGEVLDIPRLAPPGRQWEPDLQTRSAPWPLSPEVVRRFVRWTVGKRFGPPRWLGHSVSCSVTSGPARSTPSRRSSTRRTRTRCRSARTTSTASCR